ncbi:MAG: inorganic diphosphatase [Gammaproteobacteria bacterium]|nr:inorganic diphosphatase [Gammaproteobacteria bacterium]MDH3857108.1 inorganic diphosphatase [Gammaproteobacteria bacterium]
MILDRVSSGSNVPDDVNVIIEIPSHSDPVKYEVDKDTGAMFVDRFMGTSMHYPCNYGYIPQTLSEDGDPVDVLVVTPIPVISGSVIRVRPLGMLCMTDEAGKDSKIIAVPIDKLSNLYSNMSSVHDLPRSLLDSIAHFFDHYKDLESGKWVEIDGWVDTDEARREILDSIERYNTESP